MTDEELLAHLYHVKKNFGGSKQLYDKAKIQHPKITLKFVTKWLSDQASYQINQEAPKTTEFLPIYSDIPNNFQMDLTFFPKYKDENNNNWVLFTAINVNTRYAYAYYSKDKTKETILDMLKKMHSKTDINAITCDFGSEFNNTVFKDYCEKHNIIIYFVLSETHKLGLINRFHRTLKDKLKYHFADDGSLNWVDVIDKIIYNYNHDVNRGVGYAPAKITVAIENDIINNKKDETEIMRGKIMPEFLVGDKVRIERKKDLFDDKLLSRFNDTVYNVVKVYNNSLDVIDPKTGEELKPKKVQCKKVNNVVVHDVIKNTESINDKMIKAGKKTKQKAILKKDSHLPSDIITDKKATRSGLVYF